ncbi:RTP1-C1 domain-containing protein [Mycena indigotica]|uniref:RTP1-C1 domain-containing protein n=1 Tax=Mycena indigotica TaxID=2126181 RepID=A0A8H6W1K5_9AGAR|nr:RTP1-C1 domain-containing protein [Mycena indigotica]KAF7301652.1 RTP1-C1 domain-containing protein [Mycena indigotica]
MERLLRAGLCLVESSETQVDLKSVLLERLYRYYECLESNATITQSDSLDEVQLRTGLEALNTIEAVHECLAKEDLPIGTRDLAELRTLTAIAFKWAVDPMLKRVLGSDTTLLSESFEKLKTIVSRLLTIGLAHEPPTFVSTTLLNRHLDQLLRCGIAIGWFPALRKKDPTLSASVGRLLDASNPSQTIAALGTALVAKPCPVYVRKACSSLLSKQLLRAEGVRGLCAAIFGENAEEAQLDKLEHVARLLTTPPSTIRAEAYFPAIIPRILDLLSDRAPPAYRRAGAFSISRMLAIPACSLLFSLLHGPFLSFNTPCEAHKLLDTLTTLVTNTDPSPTMISSLLSPIMSSLYSLLYTFDTTRTADPSIKEAVRGLLATWGRVIATEEALAILWSITAGEGGYWRIELDGKICHLEKPEETARLTLMTPADEDIDVDTNILGLYPDPVHFVLFLKSLQRADISSDLFLRSLEAYRDSKREPDDPTRTLLYLQLVVQMQKQLVDGPSTILGNHEHILSFIKHTLDAPKPDPKPMPTPKTSPFDFGLSTDDDVASDEEELGDSLGQDDEMIETSINLLLAILETNQDLSARNAPDLNEIFTLLEPHALSGSSPIQPIAREARIVITARLASTSASSRNPEKRDDSQAVYQKALKLLQDPILPVRAHGLLLLRELVSSGQLSDQALVPAILSIFLQSLQDDDSYIFLNAVQGLAAMVNSHGKDVLKGLVKDYTQGLAGLGSGNITPHDLDVRTRIGEALAFVIKRCGSALPGYVDMLVPPLFQIVRSPQVPVTLRTSCLALLAECENTYPLALTEYVVDLAEAMVDLIQLETTPNAPAESEDTNPVVKDSKQPAFRRAALHFLGLLIRETGQDESPRPQFSGAVLRRMKTTLSYISTTDGDAVVRAMAREVVESLSELATMILGSVT